MSPSSVAALVCERTMLVCCGPGGVGKTTVAGALGVLGARSGRRCVVVTVDPARRLADAMGLHELTDEPHPVPGDWPGELWALMLDARSTFDSLVARYAPDPSRAEAILANTFYRNIAGTLSGTQEYMAMEKLFELHDDGRFDLIVVDTPPSAHALELVDAPRRLSRLLDNQVFRVLMSPARGSLRAVGLAAQVFLRTITRVVGSDVVNDAVAFFQAFQGMQEGFRQRAQAVRELLADPATAFVLVTAPRRAAVDEAGFLAGRLAETGLGVGGLVVNRVHPRLVAYDAGLAYEERARTLAGTPLGTLYRSAADLALMAEAERSYVGALVGELAPAPSVEVPMLAEDVHDLDALGEVARYVLAG